MSLASAPIALVPRSVCAYIYTVAVFFSVAVVALVVVAVGPDVLALAVRCAILEAALVAE